MKHGVTMDAETGLCDEFQIQTICREWIKQIRAEHVKMTPEECYVSMTSDEPIVSGILLRPE